MKTIDNRTRCLTRPAHLDSELGSKKWSVPINVCQSGDFTEAEINALVYELSYRAHSTCPAFGLGNHTKQPVAILIQPWLVGVVTL